MGKRGGRSIAVGTEQQIDPLRWIVGERAGEGDPDIGQNRGVLSEAPRRGATEHQLLQPVTFYFHRRLGCSPDSTPQLTPRGAMSFPYQRDACFISSSLLLLAGRAKKRASR